MMPHGSPRRPSPSPPTPAAPGPVDVGEPPDAEDLAVADIEAQESEAEDVAVADVEAQDGEGEDVQSADVEPHVVPAAVPTVRVAATLVAERLAARAAAERPVEPEQGVEPVDAESAADPAESEEEIAAPIAPQGTRRAAVPIASPAGLRGDDGSIATPLRPVSLPLSAELRGPKSSADVREFIRQAALERDVDPDVAVRVALSEGGLTPATWIGDHGSSFGPFQLHYGGIAAGGNAVAGLGDTFTAETGLNARDPTTYRQQIEWALDRAARNGWSAWHGAAAVGIGPRDGIGMTALRTAGSPRNLNAASGTVGHVDVPNQFAAGLSVQEAYAACGPVAAVSVARFLGRNPTVKEALDQAKRTGWTAAGGMNGIANEKRLLDAMHIPSQMETSLNWKHVQLNASRGTPVIVSTPAHYWVIDGYDPLTREYHVGQSGLVYRGGAEWMTADRIQQLGRGVNGALYVDHPLAPVTSLAVEPPPQAAARTAGATDELRSEPWWEDARWERPASRPTRVYEWV